MPVVQVGKGQGRVRGGSWKKLILFGWADLGHGAFLKKTQVFCNLSQLHEIRQMSSEDLMNLIDW
jgi:hypothetical protein